MTSTATTTPGTLDPMSILFDQASLRAEAATSLHTSEGRLTLTPSLEPVTFETKVHTKDHGWIELTAAIRTPSLKLIEANFYQQMFSGAADPSRATDDDWMHCVEFTIGAEGAEVGMLDESGLFIPLPFYSKLQVLRDQVPMFYGQHMRCEPKTWDDLRAMLTKEGYQVIEVGRSTEAPQRSDKRRPVAHLGAKVRDTGAPQSYASRLPQQLRSGLSVNKVVLLSNTDDKRPDGFKDPCAALFGNVEKASKDALSNDEEIKRGANRLVSSLTGTTTWEAGDGRTMKAPLRAGMADITVNGEPFNLWSTVATAGPAGATTAKPF